MTLYASGSHILGASGAVFSTSAGGGTPNPTGFSGSLSASGTFTVTGSGFGSQGPNILLVEDFEGNTAGSKISLTEPVIGAWTSFNSSNGYTASNVAAHTGTLSFNVNDVNQITNGTGTQQAVNILNLSLGGNQTEIFLSYWAYTPGSQFVGAFSNTGVSGTPPSPGTFPTDSCWKFDWLQDSLNNISGPFNMCIPTYTGGGAFQVEGAQYGILGNFGTSWFSFTTWNRIASWMRGAPSATGSQSTGFLQTLNSQVGMNTFQYGTAAANPLFQGSATEFSYINFPGYTAVCNKSQLPLYDDIYIAVGAGSIARVEIGDASTYTACQHMTILLATSWGDTAVVSTVPRSGLDFSGQAYAYVWNATGLVNTTGLAV